MSQDVNSNFTVYKKQSYQNLKIFSKTLKLSLTGLDRAAYSSRRLRLTEFLENRYM